jgi:hypothetical protein
MKNATALWLWRIPDNHPNKWIGIYNREISPDRFLFQRGQEIEELESNPTFSFDLPSSRLQKFGVVPNNSASPLVNGFVADLLNGICKDSIQFIDAAVITNDGILDGYKLVNIVNTVSSINREKSSFSLITGTNYIRSFRKLVCKLDSIPSNLLAREEEYTGNIMVANDIYDAFNFHKIKGVQFNPCEIS